MSIALNQHQRIERAPMNPADKCTVVSIFPRAIKFDVKHTIFPGTFSIAAGSKKEPAILVVGSSSWYRSVGEDSPVIEVPTGALQVANSIVNDHLNGLEGCNGKDVKPGLFYVTGELDATGLKTTHKALLDKAEEAQLRWYNELVRLADIMWARTDGNPIAISNDARLAAEQIGQKNKPWMQDFVSTAVTNCPACGHMRHNNYPVCSNCKTIIDKAAYEKLSLGVMK